MNPTKAQVDRLCQFISDQLGVILETDTFRSWLDKNRLDGGDVIILNNSFLHRDGIANRSKSAKYLCIQTDSTGRPSTDIMVAISDSRINTRFKRVSAARIKDYVRYSKPQVAEKKYNARAAS